MRLPNLIATRKGRLAAFFLLYVTEGIPLGFAATAASGGLLWLLTRRHRRELLPRDGFLLVGLTWLTLPAFGALPLMLAIPGATFTDAYFEAMSGLTTTGATVFTGLETLPLSVNVWRCFMMLVGGLGNTSFVGLPMIETWYGREYMGIGIVIDQQHTHRALRLSHEVTGPGGCRGAGAGGREDGFVGGLHGESPRIVVVGYGRWPPHAYVGTSFEGSERYFLNHARTEACILQGYVSS